MKRSQKELAALKSAYKVCLIVKEHASNVIAGSNDRFDDLESDIATYNQCEEFELWYLSMMQRQKH